MSNILDTIARKYAELLAENVDTLVARFCIENDLPASDVEIVTQYTSTGSKIYVQRKVTNEKST